VSEPISEPKQTSVDDQVYEGIEDDEAPESEEVFDEKEEIRSDQGYESDRESDVRTVLFEEGRYGLVSYLSGSRGVFPKEKIKPDENEGEKQGYQQRKGSPIRKRFFHFSGFHSMKNERYDTLDCSFFSKISRSWLSAAGLKKARSPGP